MKHVILLAGLVAAWLTVPVLAGQRPNILFIFSDDHAAQAIGAYGGRLKALNPTPNIDRLAAAGMRFENTFCTNSICGPSRAVILTGKHSHLNGFKRNGDGFDGSQQTFPKLLKKVGYETAVIGKWHLTSEPTGFDHWQVLPGQGDYYNPIMKSAAGSVEIPGYCTDIIMDLSIEWLSQQRDQSKPFMLMCQHKAPHRNWMPPARHLDLYADVTIPEPETLFDDWSDNASPASNQTMEIDRHLSLEYDLFVPPVPGWDPPRKDESKAHDKSGVQNIKRMTPRQRAAWDAAFGPRNQAFRDANLSGRELVRWKYQRYMKNYLRCIRALDDGIGRLLDHLEATGLAENTIVIYSSDQGFFLGEHGWFDKRWMYEESLRMPLIVHWPGVTKPGATSDALTQNLDFASTFLDLAGAAIPGDLQGHSLVPLFKGQQPADWRDAIYYRYFEFPAIHMVARHYGIRTARFKLIHFYQTDEWELYDLELDPDERKNIYTDTKYAATVESLKKQLAQLRAEAKDDAL